MCMRLCVYTHTHTQNVRIAERINTSVYVCIHTHTQRENCRLNMCVYREREGGAEQVREKERGTKRQPKKLKSKNLNCSLTSNAIFG